tara:strand:+ start:1223 stop:4765 length:3543 start_codon:yes stop_codon:yes gene_type:complete
MSIVANRFGQSVPDVFIGSIKISKGYDSLKERENTRNSRVSKDHRTLDRYNDDYSSRVQGGSGAQLIVTVNLYVKEVVDSSNHKAWLNNSKVNKNIKIRVVQSLSQGATREISRSPIQMFPGGYYDKISQTSAEGAATSVICRDIDLQKLDSFEIKNYLTTRTSEYKVYDIPYQIIFSIPNDNPSHLTYFAACYYDPNMDMLHREKRSRLPLISSLGKVAAEQVIRNKKTLKTSKYYSLEDTGDPFFGPIYHRDTGEAYTGLTKNIGRDEKLASSTIPNIKIADYRVFDRFKKVDISFKENEKDMIKASNTIKSKINYNKKNDDVFFTDLYLNRNRNGVVNLLFGIKTEKIFKNYSHYAKLYNNPDDAIVHDLLSASKIRKLRIIRRRVDENKTSFDRLRGKKIKSFTNPDGSYDDHVVVETFDVPIIKTGSSKFKASKKDKYTEEEIGSINNIDLSLGNTGDIIFLQVSDKQIAKVTEGHFQYGIELEIEDRTQNFLISKLSNFERSIKNYERVANIARRAGYNQYNKKYTENFMSLTTVLNFSSGPRTPWSSLLMQFIKTINMFMGHNPQLNEELQADMARTLFSLTCPISNNPKDMDFVRTTMLELASKIRNKLTFDSSLNNRKKITHALHSKNESTPRMSVFKLEKYFGNSYKGYSNNNITSEIVNASIDPNYGYEYFDTGEAVEGLKTYNASDIMKRTKIETLRYYSNENPTLSLKVDEKVYTNKGFTLANKHRYYAPSHVTLGGDKTVNLIDEEENIFNKNKNVALLLDIMGYNMSQIENNMTDYTKHSYSEKINSYLAFRDVNRIVNNRAESELEKQNYAIADNYFGKTTKFIVNKEVTDDQELIDMINKESNSRYKSKNKNLRRVVETNTAGNGVMLSLLGAHYLKTLEPIKDLEKWNLRNPDNVIAFLDGVKSEDTIRNEAVDIRTTPAMKQRPANQISPEKQKIIKEMPMQLKSLLHHGINNVVKNNFRKELFSSNFNPLQDTSKFIMFWLMHGQLVELQAYVGHNTINNDTNIKSPLWQPITPDSWNNIVNRKLTLCRVVRYKNPTLLGTYPESLDLPIYNEYFLIKGNSTSPGRDTKLKTRISQKVEKIISNSERAYARGIQPEYLFNAQVATGRSNVERPVRPRPQGPLDRGGQVGRTQAAQASAPTVATQTPAVMNPGNTGGSGGY